MKQLIIFALVCLPLLCACGGSQQKEADATYKTLTVTQSDQILKPIIQLRYEGGSMLKFVRR